MKLENTWTKWEPSVPGPYVQSKIVYMTSTSGTAMTANGQNLRRVRLISETEQWIATTNHDKSMT